MAVYTTGQSQELSSRNENKNNGRDTRSVGLQLEELELDEIGRCLHLSRITWSPPSDTDSHLLAAARVAGKIDV